MSDAIRVKSIFKHYKQFSLEDISFELPIGYIMGLVGPNGAGKTTIIKAIMNAVNLSEGTIEVLGFDSVSGEIQIKESTAYKQSSDKDVYENHSCLAHSRTITMNCK